ncbi:hypothetical protein ACP4OV_014451 [Aristida adscensionis]
MSDNPRHSSSYAVLANPPDLQCLVCARPFALDTEVTDSFEDLAICRECTLTVVNDNNRDEATRAHRGRRRRRSRSRAARNEPTEDAFSQEFSQLINLARQGHETDMDSPAVSRQRASYNSTPNRSQRWHASDDESDGLSYVDSIFGEIESHISFGDYSGESDADIDPMNAGMDQWNSEGDEDEQSGESAYDEVFPTIHLRHPQRHGDSPSRLNEQESEDVVWLWRTQSHGVDRTNLLADAERIEFRRPFIGNPGDYVDARQFEMLLGQFAEDNSMTRGAPPAATSFVENLPSVVVCRSHETNGGVLCPVCKDHMPIKTIAKQLPCMHLYHSSCILPWLGSRNTCPVCRYELPTDDPEYERSRRVATDESDTHGMGQTQQQEIVEENSDELTSGAIAESSTSAQQPNRERGSIRWLFVAAAPVVSLVGLGIVFCFTNPTNSGRRQPWRRSQNTSAAPVDTKRSWWSMF